MVTTLDGEEVDRCESCGCLIQRDVTDPETWLH